MEEWRKNVERFALELPGASEHIRGLAAWYDSPEGQGEIDVWLGRRYTDSNEGRRKIVHTGLTMSILGIMTAMIGSATKDNGSTPVQEGLD